MSNTVTAALVVSVVAAVGGALYFGLQTLTSQNQQLAQELRSSTQSIPEIRDRVARIEGKMDGTLTVISSLSRPGGADSEVGRFLQRVDAVNARIDHLQERTEQIAGDEYTLYGNARVRVFIRRQPSSQVMIDLNDAVAALGSSSEQAAQFTDVVYSYNFRGQQLGCVETASMNGSQNARLAICAPRQVAAVSQIPH